MAKEECILLRVGDHSAFEFQRGPNDLALFAGLGAALAEIQSFETGIAIQLGLLSHRSTDSLDEFYSKTLGTLIKQIQRHLPDNALASLLEKVRNRRNYLVHHILRAYGWPIMSDDDYIRAIREIEEVRSLIEQANLEVARYLSDRSLLKLIVLSIDHRSSEVSREI